MIQLVIGIFTSVVQGLDVRLLYRHGHLAVHVGSEGKEFCIVPLVRQVINLILVYLIFLTRLGCDSPLVFMIDTQIAVLADAFCVESAVRMAAGGCELCAAFRVIAVLAHPVGIVGLGSVCALSDHLPMFLAQARFLRITIVVAICDIL